MKLKSIEVQELKPGMTLAFTYAKVITHPLSGISKTHNSMDFIVRRKDGMLDQKSWNRNRLVAICL
jgi:hypothetical protein